MNNWILKNKTLLILVVLILIAVSWIFIREAVIKKQTRKIDALEFDNFALARERNKLKDDILILKKDFLIIQDKNDSMKTALALKQKELKELEEKHKKEIDSLLKIPIDTIYKRLQAIYVNYDSSPLLYPFSAAQITPMYRTAISYPLLKEEYVLQGKTLGNCLDLNKGYEKAQSNLKSQISNLETNISLCDKQVINYESEVKMLKKKIKFRGFWAKTWFTTLLIVTGIAMAR